MVRVDFLDLPQPALQEKGYHCRVAFIPSLNLGFRLADQVRTDESFVII